MWGMSIFLLLGSDCPPSTRFSPKVGLGEGVEQSIHGGGNKQGEIRWNIFGKMGNRGGITQGYNSAGHYFVLKDLVSIDKKLSSRLADFGR